MSKWAPSPWEYPGRVLDADNRTAETWPRHKARARRKRQRALAANRTRQETSL